MIVEEIKKSILQSASEGKLTKQKKEEDVEKEIISILEDSKDDKKYAYSELNSTPFKIPNNWKWVRLEDIAIKITDGTHSTPKYESDGVPFLSVKDLSSGVMNFNNTKFISKNEHDLLYKRCNPEFGDILITKVGTTGIPVIVDSQDEFSLFVSVALIKFNHEKIFNKYLYYILLSPVVQSQVVENTRGVGNKNWVLNAIKNTIFPFPPLEEQKRIVDKIEELFSKLDNIKPIEEELKDIKNKFSIDIKKSIIDYAIHGFLCNQNNKETLLETILPNKNEYKMNLEKFDLNINESEFPFDIPNNWEWVKLGMLFNYQNGYSYKPSETSKHKKGYPIIKSQNIMKRIVEINDKTSYIENPTEQMLKSKILKGDFLMCLSSQSSNPEPLGKTAIYDCNEIALLNQRVLKLTPLNNKFSKYLYYAINSFYFHNTVSHKGGGSAQSNLKLEHVMEMYIPLPPIEEQQRIVEKLEQLLPLCDDIEKMISK